MTYRLNVDPNGWERPRLERVPGPERPWRDEPEPGECPRCKGDGELPDGRFCGCGEGLALAFEVASRAAFTPYEERRNAA